VLLSAWYSGTMVADSKKLAVCGVALASVASCSVFVQPTRNPDRPAAIPRCGSFTEHAALIEFGIGATVFVGALVAATVAQQNGNVPNYLYYAMIPSSLVAVDGLVAGIRCNVGSDDKEVKPADFVRPVQSETNKIGAPPTTLPPPNPVEEPPPQPPGEVWQAGEWRWNPFSQTWAWFPGRWMSATPGQQWQPGRWELQDGKVVHIEGAWVSAGAAEPQ